MSETGVVKGYKVFNQNWTCRDKQYTCPGVFEEDVTPSVCNRGMHFCKRASDCFNYYSFNPENKVAEVIAFTDCTVEDGDKCATKHLEIVREIPWAELLEIVNVGKACSGLRNSGNRNSGDWNSGNRNSGNRNSGNRNSGNRNSGDWNSGDWNSGWHNSGDCNSGNYNSGNWNSGNCNSGDCNSGNYNSGNWNSGRCNSGDWNKTDYSSGCFNTKKQTIVMFNKPSLWTFEDWQNSKAFFLLEEIPKKVLIWTRFDKMTDKEKEIHQDAEVTGGYSKEADNTSEKQKWWNKLSDDDKKEIFSLPNFDAEIFKEITGIDVEVKDE